MKYFIIENGQQAGPFDINQLAQKSITSKTLVWAEGMEEWTPAWKVQELRPIIDGTYHAAETEETNRQQEPPIPPTNPATDAYQQGFQQGFQQAQQAAQQYMQHPRKKSNKTLWKALLICVLIILALFAITNPGKNAHKEAIRTELGNIIDRASESDGNDFFSQGFKMMTSMFASNMLNSVIEELFEYHNYILFSKGTVDFNGETHTVSFGILGSVYTINADDVTKALEKGNGSIKIMGPSSTDGNDSREDEENTDNQASPSARIQQKLEEKANETANRITDKVSQKVEEKINERIEEATDSSKIEKLVNKILELL